MSIGCRDRDNSFDTEYRFDNSADYSCTVDTSIGNADTHIYVRSVVLYMDMRNGFHHTNTGQLP